MRAIRSPSFCPDILSDLNGELKPVTVDLDFFRTEDDRGSLVNRLAVVQLGWKAAHYVHRHRPCDHASCGMWANARPCLLVYAPSEGPGTDWRKMSAPMTPASPPSANSAPDGAAHHYSRVLPAGVEPTSTMAGASLVAFRDNADWRPTQGRRRPCVNPYCNAEDVASRSRRGLFCLPCGESCHE